MVTAQALSPTAAIVSVIPRRKGSVLEAGRVRKSRSGGPWIGLKWAEPLVMCHCRNSSTAVQSVADQVNSPIRRKAAKATQKAALRVAPSYVDLSSLVTRRRRRLRVIGSRSRGAASRAAWKILMPLRIRCGWGSSKADRLVIPRSMQYERRPVR